MAWPFSHVVAPNVDSGFTAIPTSTTTIDSATQWITGLTVCNPSTGSLKFSLTDTAGNAVIDELVIAPNSVNTYSFPFMPMTGSKWFANASGLTGKLWGYK